MHIHVHIHTCTHTYIHTYIHTWMYMSCMYVVCHVHNRLYIRLTIHTCMYVFFKKLQICCLPGTCMHVIRDTCMRCFKDAISTIENISFILYTYILVHTCINFKYCHLNHLFCQILVVPGYCLNYTVHSWIIVLSLLLCIYIHSN